MATDLQTLQEALGHRFQDADLLRLAVTHPSVTYEGRGGVDHNQRLEFLGDAVLELILTRQLYERFPLLGEGALTKARARLVNRRFLAEQGRRLALGTHLILGRSEESQGGRERPSALADAFEAVVGAVFLDGGLPAAEEFVRRQFENDLAELPTSLDHENPKGALQERLQATSPEPPRYRVEQITGPHHDREFECAVFHQDLELGRGRGKSKQAAETQAAAAALQKLRAVAPVAILPPHEDG